MSDSKPDIRAAILSDYKDYIESDPEAVRLSLLVKDAAIGLLSAQLAQAEGAKSIERAHEIRSKAIEEAQVLIANAIRAAEFEEAKGDEGE